VNVIDSQKEIKVHDTHIFDDKDVDGTTQTNTRGDLFRFHATNTTRARSKTVVNPALESTPHGFYYELSDITQGDNDNQRIGNDIKAKSIFISGTVCNGDDTFNNIDIILLKVTNSGASGADIQDIFQFPEKPYSVLRRDTDETGNYSIICRKKVPLHNFSGNAATGNECKIVELYKRLNFKITYNGTGDTDGQMNRLYVIILSDSGSGSATHPKFQGTFRFKFVD